MIKSRDINNRGSSFYPFFLFPNSWLLALLFLASLNLPSYRHP